MSVDVENPQLLALLLCDPDPLKGVTPDDRAGRDALPHPRGGRADISLCASSSSAAPDELDLDETLVLPAYRHYRLLQRIHTPGTGQLSPILSEADEAAIRRPHPEVLQILDPRPLLDEAASVGAAYGSAACRSDRRSPPD